MTPNTGSRPSGLSDTDQVRVVLHNGTERIWAVRTRNTQGISWHVLPESDPCHPFSIKEWERVG